MVHLQVVRVDIEHQDVVLNLYFVRNHESLHWHRSRLVVMRFVVRPASQEVLRYLRANLVGYLENLRQVLTVYT